MTHASEFRRSVTDHLEQRPLPTPLGEVIPETRVVRFGYRVGSHGPIDCWVYRRSRTKLEMLFAFHKNYNPDGLICKVTALGEPLEPAVGA